MHKRQLIGAFWILVPLSAFTQKQANVWHFGEGAGLTFNMTPPSAVSGGQTYYPAPNEWNEGTSSICDSTGALLFYSNGAKVWDRNHQILPNGGDLLGHPSSTHAALIVPLPNSDRFFYLFTTDASENNFANGLRYSVIDACARNGMGDIDTTAKNVLLHGNMAEKLAAVQHTNGVDYWIVGHEYGSNVFHLYLLTEQGITDSLSVSSGPVDTVGYGGQIVIRPDGSMLAYASPSLQGFLAVFDLDTSTGSLTNARIWPNTMPHMVWGLAFSPDGSKLYLTTGNQGSLRQLDMNVSTWAGIQSSEIILGTLIPERWRDLRLGPDGKIYVAHAQNPALGTINFPNELGVACQFQDNTVLLTSNCSFGLPNVVCDYSYYNDVEVCV